MRFQLRSAWCADCQQAVEVCVEMVVPMGMGFPRELDLNRDGNGNTETWEWERLLLVGSKNHSCFATNS